MACLSFCLVASATRPALAGGFSDPGGYFEATIPQNGWERLSWKGVELVLWDKGTGGTIAVDVTPVKEKETIAAHLRELLLAFEGRKILSQQAQPFKGRESIRTVLSGWAEGTEIMAEIYCLQGEGVWYDILYWAPRAAFPAHEEAFHLFLDGITLHRP